MAGNLTDYLENALLGHLTGQAAMGAPGATYAALFTVAPTDSTAGTEVSTSGTNYARQAVTWGAASGGSIANSAQIKFPSSGNATANFGTVVAIGIMDASTSGNLLMYGSLSATVTINTGDNFTITAGGLTLSLD
jgi:hypothetical protein